MGETNSFGAGNADVYLIRTDADGDTIWVKTYGGADSERGHSIRQTFDGGFIIAGETRSFGAGSNDLYLIRTDSIGDTIWTKTFGGPYNEEGYAVQQTGDSGYVIVGQKAIYSPTNPDNIDLYLVRTNSLGDTLWTKTFDVTGYDVGYSVQTTSFGGFIITGKIYYVDSTTEDVYLLHVKSDSDTFWTRSFGEYSVESGSSVKQTFDGGFIVAGYTWSMGAGFYDVYLIRVDPEGYTLWEQTFGGTEYDEANSVQQTSDGGFIIAGSTQSFGAGKCDVYLIRLAPITDIQKSKLADNLYADDFKILYDYRTRFISMHYTVQFTCHVKLAMYGIQGKLVKVFIDNVAPKGPYSVRWDTKLDDGKTMAGGVYFLTLRTHDTAVSKKITIIK